MYIRYRIKIVLRFPEKGINMDNRMFNRGFTVFLTMALLLLFSIYRVCSISRGRYSHAGSAQGTKTLTVTTQRAGIFDCRGEKLTGVEHEKKAAVQPGQQAYNCLYKILDDDVFDTVGENLLKGYPVCVSVKRTPFCEGIDTFEVPLRYGSTAAHVIGYTDGTAGVSGIEKSFDGFLANNSGEISVRYAVDASGRVTGKEKSIKNTVSSSYAGVYLTIDRQVQQAAEYAMDKKGIDSGAAVVIEIKSGEIKAMVSRPDFDPGRVGNYLEEENSPLLNKALCAYSVGSVFKSVVAAAGLEQGEKESTAYECKGEISVSGTLFSCVHKIAHGKTDLVTALTKSCNGYFIRYARKIEKSFLVSLCRSLGFGEETRLAPEMSGQTGMLPDETELVNPGDYANFSFGQGKFSATPLQLAAAYAALVSDGIYRPPRLVYGTLDTEGTFEEYPAENGYRVISEETAKKIRKMLCGVVENGCMAAKPFFTDAGGKTGTAQSGIYGENGEICRAWFAGFFPADEPEYAAVILKEDGTSGSQDCAPVFRLLADEIMKNR